jgi:hypothetical protein
MELDEALGRIHEIRAQLARTETFRGFRSVTVGFSGILGMAAAGVQAARLPQPTSQVTAYLQLWMGVALLSVLVVAVELAYRWLVTDSPRKRHLTVLTTQQFAPCLVAGAAITAVIYRDASEAAWMLPGLWAICFSLGIFACSRLLPQATVWVGVHYLVSGTFCLTFGPGPHALSPWMMAGTFGIGQLVSAAVLYYALERTYEPRTR